MPAIQPTRTRGGHAGRSRGQVVVIFAMSIFLFVGLCAVVVDISWYWVNTLRVQRAADAAALAGVVYLPGDTTNAFAEARASAKQNGYTTGVTPVQDGLDPRQLDVTITANVPTFFARVVGVSSWPVTRSAKGVYVLPVPMGSPDAYYGVGNFSFNQTTTYPTTHAAGVSGCGPASASWSASCKGNVGTTSTPSSGGWTTSSGSLVNSVNANDTVYAQDWDQSHAAEVELLRAAGRRIPGPQPGRHAGPDDHGDRGSADRREAGRGLQQLDDRG